MTSPMTNPAMNLRRRALLRAALALPAGALGACGGGGTPKLTKLPADAVVLAFGDSLTFGTGATPETSYPAQLARLIGRNVIASGVPGEVSATGLMRLPGVLEEAQPKLLLLCHGGNDLLRKLDERQAMANLREMVKLARAKGIEVVLLGVPKPGLLLSTAGWYGELAKELKLPFEDGALASILRDNDLKADLAHPNAKGYAKLAEAVAALLKKAGAV